jgi:signal transduction histidine kinase
MQEARKRHAADLEVERRAAIARDEFFAAVSHELRTPLTTILGFSEVLIDGSAHPGEQQEMMGLIRKDAIDLERRIDDLVAAARSAANGLNTEVDDFAIESAIADVVRASGVAAEVHTECESAEVRADPVAVRQIVRNLVSNAGRHGGPRVWVSGRVVGDRYLVAVSDNGPGFDPDVINTPRGPFAHDNQEAILEGTIGLGLGAAVALAEASKGSLVYRRVSGWTQVGLFLPLIPPAAPMHHLESELPEARTA